MSIVRVAPGERGSFVVIGGSAGSLEPFLEIVSSLPDSFEAPILYVRHISREIPTRLEQLVEYRSKMPAFEVENGQKPQSGAVYVSRPAHHVTIENGEFVVTPSQPGDRFVCSIDQAISSCAKWYRAGNIAVLLSGMMDDGIEGLVDNYRYGGTTLVQRPSDAEFEDMPVAALMRDHADDVLVAEQIAPHLAKLMSRSMIR